MHLQLCCSGSCWDADFLEAGASGDITDADIDSFLLDIEEQLCREIADELDRIEAEQEAAIHHMVAQHEAGEHSRMRERCMHATQNAGGPCTICICTLCMQFPLCLDALHAFIFDH